MSRPIYLDHNATTPIFPEVVDAMRDCWERRYANPASQHEFGRQARRTLEAARDRIGELLGAGDDDCVLFTSGGTESNNLAIRSLLQRSAACHHPSARPAHLIISAVEHQSITALADELQHQGHDVEKIPVDAHGVIRANALPHLLRPNTAFVAAILGQNETGVLQPVAELAAICATRGMPLHTDATQVAGKLPVNFRDLGATTMTVAAHKFHGPVGIGALIYRDDIELQPQLFGGFQQAGLRPGTESVALAVGMCRALDFGSRLIEMREHTMRLQERAAQICELRDRFERAILLGWPDARVIGAEVERLPQTSNIAFVGLDRQALFMALDQAGVACSTGSACASGSSEISPVLIAMGCSEAVLESALRFSLGVTTTAADIDEAARRILHCCTKLRQAK
ncbi:MAG: cysteine desulfurase family protein [Pirellulales bacterium]